SACTTYDPGVRNGTANRPSPSVTAVFTPCDPVAVTVTPGTARFCASTIRPAIVPVVSCAAALWARQPAIKPTISTQSLFTDSPPRTAMRACADGGCSPWSIGAEAAIHFGGVSRGGKQPQRTRSTQNFLTPGLCELRGCFSVLR